MRQALSILPDALVRDLRSRTGRETARRVVTVRKYSHRLIDVLSHRLYRYHRGGGSFEFSLFPRFRLVLIIL